MVMVYLVKIFTESHVLTKIYNAFTSKYLAFCLTGALLAVSTSKVSSQSFQAGITVQIYYYEGQALTLFYPGTFLGPATVSD